MALTGRFPVGLNSLSRLSAARMPGGLGSRCSRWLVGCALAAGPARDVWRAGRRALGYWTLLGLAGRRARLVAVHVRRRRSRAVDRRGGPSRPPVPAGGDRPTSQPIVAVALPTNLVRLFDGGDHLAADAELTRGEFAMLELAGIEAEPGFVPGSEEDRVPGSSPYIGMNTATYLQAAERIGSLADPLERIRAEDITLRQVDDLVLARALGLDLEPMPRPGVVCRRVPASVGVIAAPPKGVVIRAAGGPVAVAVSRFVPGVPIVQLGRIGSGRWVRLELHGPDAAPDPWRVFFDGPLRVCGIG